MVLREKVDALLTAIAGGAVERWWTSLGLSKKTYVALKAFGLYLGMNAFIFASVRILWWAFTSPVGHWLELDRRPARPYVPGTIYLSQILLLAFAYLYYRNTVKRTKKN